MPKYSDKDLKEAIEDAKSGTSLRRAANQHGVPYSTLRNRIHGKPTRNEAHEWRQLLPKSQEDLLCDWLIMQDKLGMALTHGQIWKLAISMLGENGRNQQIGKYWVTGFLRRNKRIKTLKSKGIDQKRIGRSRPDLIRRFFDLLDQPGVKSIPPRNRWNFDETGVFQGLGTNGLVVGQSQLRSTIKKQPFDLNWITIIEAISATESCLSPLVILKGKDVQHQWFPEELDYLTNWQFTTSEKGWTNDAIGLEWLKKVFLPGSKPAKTNEKRLLILDGHGSHITPDFMRICVTNRVHLLYLPPHTSHVLQPLDISVFGPLKAAYRAALTLANPLADVGPTRKEDFLNCYFQARNKAITTHNALSGWKGAGLWPINMLKPMGSKFVIHNPDDSITVQSGAPISPKRNQRSEIIPFTTPNHSKDVTQLVRSHKQEIYDSPTTRLLLWTINKGFDRLHLRIIQLEDQVSSLTRKLDQSNPRKRGRVYKDPNSLFTAIRNVRQARRRIRTPEIEDSE
jgi:hypothetical protein